MTNSTNSISTNVASLSDSVDTKFTQTSVSIDNHFAALNEMVSDSQEGLLETLSTNRDFALRGEIEKILRQGTLLASFAGTAMVGLLDYVSGYEVRLFPLYFIPIAFGAWHNTRAWALALAVTSAGFWALSNWLAGRVYSSPFIWPANFTSQLVAFGTIGVLVAELRRRLIIEEGLSRGDNLTSLMNSRAFHGAAELLLGLGRRSDRPITFAYLDLDNFKQVNDERGHAESDRALATMAEVLKGQFRASDLVARLGGDEFAILLHDAGPDAARASLERMRDLVAAAMRRNDWPVTVSAGRLIFGETKQKIRSGNW